jgi:serine/threonine protein kinase
MTYIINKKYTLLDKIGEGSFGSIYKAHNIRTEEYVAVKVEPIKNATKLLKNESIIYHYLNNVKGMPSVKWFGKDDNNYYMVINLLGKSLQDVKNKHFNFHLKTVLQIGVQLIQLLQKIHDKGLIHRDIKPENFLFGLNNESKHLYMIDFGFCKSFIQDDKHIPQKKTGNLIGSHTYASINAHKFIELSRRDDLESVGYMLIYFYLGTLSWQDISELSNGCYNNNGKDDSSIIYLKTQIVETDLLPEVLTNYMKYVRALAFEEKPDYKWIIDTFLKQIELFQKIS